MELYAGLYLLQEKIKADDSRVDVLKIAEYVDVILDSRKEYNAYQFF
jgi:PHD/YefM family antitoxin component YafN of YafNO toxin-antitoxin module